MSAVQLDGILNAISGIPDLERGLCVGNWETFDQEDDPGVTEDRVELCLRCPVLEACGSWVVSLPPRQRPPGTTAGQVRCLDKRPRKATA